MGEGMRAVFDHFAKLVTLEGARVACVTGSEHEIRHDAQRADVFVEPDPERVSLLEPLGLLGRLCSEVAILEFFHGTPGVHRIEACLTKILAFRRKRRREQRSEPVQWIVVSGRPRSAMLAFGFQPAPDWGPGVYECPPGMGTRIVVANELPRTRFTLLIRLLGGSGGALEGARRELLSLPKRTPEGRIAWRIMVALWPEMVGGRMWPEEAVAEFRRKMGPILYAWDRDFVEAEVKGLEKGLVQGHAEGLVEGRAAMLLEVYEARFGAVPRWIATAVTKTKAPAVLQRWVRMFSTASAEEIAATLRAARAQAKKRSAASARRAQTSAKKQAAPHPGARRSPARKQTPARKQASAKKPAAARRAKA